MSIDYVAKASAKKEDKICVTVDGKLNCFDSSVCNK